MSSEKPKLAVIGAGIAGMAMAWLARDEFDVVLYEAEARLGGHADTQLVTLDRVEVAVDTGFIVLNDRNYPNLEGFFRELDVATHDTEMTFGVSIGDGALEYGGSNLAQLFAQKTNLLRPRFWRMIQDILRFNREAPALLTSETTETLGDYLDRNRYSAGFTEDHILPMGAAIWSASVAGMRAFPARHFVRFFHNHGLLTINDRPQWRTVTGGSRMYVAKLRAALGARVRSASPVHRVSRMGDRVSVSTDHDTAMFDQIVLACHADQALAMIEQPTPEERALLGAVRFQANTAVLHTDPALMPRRKAVWSAWNYLSRDAADHGQAISVTYWMNALQSIKTAKPLLVSLNPLIPPDPAQVLLRRDYTHPVFDTAAMAAQAALPGIQGVDRLWFAGAWTGWGFHEDGIASAVRIAQALGLGIPWQARTERRAA
jgi:predicted NAD/FAD-binding protein